MKNIEMPIGRFMLLWFTNPDNTSSDNSLCSQFFTSLEQAEDLAKHLSGNRIILMCTGQNPSPDSNAYWSMVKSYGNNFNLKELTILPDELKNVFSNIGKLTSYLEEAKEKGWTIDKGELIQRFNLKEYQINNIVNRVYFK